MIREIGVNILREKKFDRNPDEEQEFDVDIMEGKVLFSRSWCYRRDFILEFEDDEMSYSFSPTENGGGGAHIVAVEGESDDCFCQEVESASLIFQFGRQTGSSTDTATLIISFGDSDLVVIWEREAQPESKFVKLTVA